MGFGQGWDVEWIAFGWNQFGCVCEGVKVGEEGLGMEVGVRIGIGCVFREDGGRRQLERGGEMRFSYGQDRKVELGWGLDVYLVRYMSRGGARMGVERWGYDVEVGLGQGEVIVAIRPQLSVGWSGQVVSRME